MGDTPDVGCILFLRFSLYSLFMSRAFRILILYGSQTGNARTIAERLALHACRLFRLRNYPADCPASLIHVSSADEYQPLHELASEPGPVIFICSTTGCGDPPDNMAAFWRKIMNVRLPEGCTFPISLRFVVLGIGDSSYKHYNHVAKKLYRRLVHLGASPLPVSLALADKTQDIGLGLADDSAPEGIIACMQWFIPSLWNTIHSHYSTSIQTLGTLSFPITWDDLENPEFVASLQSRFVVRCLKKHDTGPNTVNSVNGTQFENDKYLTERIEALLQHDNSLFKGAPMPSRALSFVVVSNERLTPEDYFQDTRLIKLELETPCPDGSLKFLPGSVFHVQPTNSLENVLAFFTITGIDPSTRIRVEVLREAQRPGEHIVPFPLPGRLSDVLSDSISMAWLVTNYFDLNCLPSQFFFSNLAATHFRRKQVASESVSAERIQMECERLNELGHACTAEAMDDFYDYVTRPRRRIVEVLADFPCTAAFIPVESWLDILPGPIHCRPYSIASAAPTIELLIAVVSFRTRMLTLRQGLATTFLARCPVGSRISGWISRPVYGFDFTYCLTPPTHPCILVGPGTGVAPFRAFIWYQLSRASDNGVFSTPPNVLFFGCRFSKKDFYFQKEWERLEAEGRLKLITAFSRDGRAMVAKNRTYVQHRILENAGLVWSLLNEAGASVYVAGNAKAMPAAVRESLVEVVRDCGNMTDLEAEAYISNLESSGRYQVEAWT
uniref:NADPH-dependent diflavin oxidoreductase 1 n=2 Tax=Schistocephalus solidus TaxID=70667 RepID=A0A0V0J3I2_SCHSO